MTLIRPGGWNKSHFFLWKCLADHISSTSASPNWYAVEGHYRTARPFDTFCRSLFGFHVMFTLTVCTGWWRSRMGLDRKSLKSEIKGKDGFSSFEKNIRVDKRAWWFRKSSEFYLIIMYLIYIRIQECENYYHVTCINL